MNVTLETQPTDAEMEEALGLHIRDGWTMGAALQAVLAKRDGPAGAPRP